MTTDFVLNEDFDTWDDVQLTFTARRPGWLPAGYSTHGLRRTRVVVGGADASTPNDLLQARFMAPGQRAVLLIQGWGVDPPSLERLPAEALNGTAQPANGTEAIWTKGDIVEQGDGTEAWVDGLLHMYWPGVPPYEGPPFGYELVSSLSIEDALRVASSLP